MIFSSEFWSSPRRADRQTDRKRLLRAHRALAQVGSKSSVVEVEEHLLLNSPFHPTFISNVQQEEQRSWQRTSVK